MQTSIRLATPHDDAAIGELLVDAFVAAYGVNFPGQNMVSDARKADLRNVASKRELGRVFVSENDGQIVGTVTVYPPGASGTRAWLPDAVDLRYLAMASAMHGRGLSVPLMDRAEQWAREIGARYVSLNVRKGANGIARMYLARGYVRDPRGDQTLPGDVKLEGYLLTL